MGRLGNYKEEIETPMNEQEKADFVSGKFLYAITDFSLFKRGEAYWLEYIGNDTYCCRSDNRLNEKIRIKPWELKRYFSEEPLHSFENILSEFAYHVRTWGLTDGESNIDFCNVEAHRYAKEMIKATRKMNEEDYDLLMKDLCGRLPYGVKANVSEWDKEKQEEVNIPRRVHSIDTDGYLVFESNGYGLNYYWIRNCALLLRPLSSMTEEEREEYRKYVKEVNGFTYNINCSDLIDWFNRKMFDYRGLIQKGLAIEAPKGMYNN